MIKDIIKDEEILSTPCEEATIEDEEVAEDLLDTLACTESAAALAANQIGVTKRIIAYLDDNERPHVMYNPVVFQALRPAKMYETCLSRDDGQYVKRFAWIKVDYQEPKGGELVSKRRVFENWEAELIQHMIDHCNGKLV